MSLLIVASDQKPLLRDVLEDLLAETRFKSAEMTDRSSIFKIKIQLCLLLSKPLSTLRFDRPAQLILCGGTSKNTGVTCLVLDS